MCACQTHHKVLTMVYRGALTTADDAMETLSIIALDQSIPRVLRNAIMLRFCETAATRSRLTRRDAAVFGNKGAKYNWRKYGKCWSGRIVSSRQDPHNRDMWVQILLTGTSEGARKLASTEERAPYTNPNIRRPYR